MAEPTFLYCIGAPKAGTSWLYRYFWDHPDVGLRAVKELHYFDTFAGDKLDKQLVAFRKNRDRFRAVRAEAEAAGRGWQVDNMDRRIVDMNGLIEVLEGDRTGDAAYRRYVEGPGGAVVADMTPAYGLQTEDGFARMAAVSPNTRFLYLLRDPVERLWSHVRMQAKRFLQEGEEVPIKAGRILNRVIHKGQETHIPIRGDYRGTIERLTATVPARQVHIEICEDMFAGPGLSRICDFLGLTERPVTEDRVHEGEDVPLSEAQRRDAVHYLRDQYDYVAKRLGALPEAWRHNYDLAMA